MVNKNLVLGFAAALWTVPVLAQQDPATVQIQTQKLAGNVFKLMGDGGNIGLSIGADGSVLVDTEYAPLNAKIPRGHRPTIPKPTLWITLLVRA